MEKVEDKKATQPTSEEMPTISITGKPVAEIEKPLSSWKFFWTNKRYVLPLFFTLCCVLVSGYISSPLKNANKNTYFLIDIVVLVLCTLLSMLFIYLIRRKMKKVELHNKNFMFIILFGYLFFEGFVITIVFRLIALYDPNNIFNIGGLISLFSSIAALLLVFGMALIPFKRLAYTYKDEKVADIIE